MTDEFRSKLGWLTGNMYSRVATRDWPKEDLKGIINTSLGLEHEGSGTAAADRPRWVFRDSVKHANNASMDLTGLSEDQITEKVNKFSHLKPNEQALEAIVSTVRKGIPLSDHDADNLRGRLGKDPILREILGYAEKYLREIAPVES